jgi:hypothetical protein
MITRIIIISSIGILGFMQQVKGSGIAEGDIKMLVIEPSHSEGGWALGINADGEGDLGYFFANPLTYIPPGTFSGENDPNQIKNRLKMYLKRRNELSKRNCYQISFFYHTNETRNRADTYHVEEEARDEIRKLYLKAMDTLQATSYISPERLHARLLQYPIFPGAPSPPSVEELKARERARLEQMMAARKMTPPPSAGILTASATLHVNAAPSSTSDNTAPSLTPDKSTKSPEVAKPQSRSPTR